MCRNLKGLKRKNKTKHSHAVFTTLARQQCKCTLEWHAILDVCNCETRAPHPRILWYTPCGKTSAAQKAALPFCHVIMANFVMPAVRVGKCRQAALASAIPRARQDNKALSSVVGRCKKLFPIPSSEKRLPIRSAFTRGGSRAKKLPLECTGKTSHLRVSSLSPLDTKRIFFR